MAWLKRTWALVINGDARAGRWENVVHLCGREWLAGELSRSI